MNEVMQDVQLVQHTENPEQLIELAGRVSYKSEDKITPESAGKFVRMLVANGHHSVLEHPVATLRFITDRGISHEAVRHRIGVALTQESTRWVNYGSRGGEINVIRPVFQNPESYSVWEFAMKCAEECYLQLIELGEKPQDARSVLPTCTKTEIVATLNLRAWRHFIEMRGTGKAHHQIQWIAKRCWEILMKIAPNVFMDLEDKVFGRVNVS